MRYATNNSHCLTFSKKWTPAIPVAESPHLKSHQTEPSRSDPFKPINTLPSSKSPWSDLPSADSPPPWSWSWYKLGDHNFNGKKTGHVSFTDDLESMRRRVLIGFQSTTACWWEAKAFVAHRRYLDLNRPCMRGWANGEGGVLIAASKCRDGEWIGAMRMRIACCTQASASEL